MLNVRQGWGTSTFRVPGDLCLRLAPMLAKLGMTCRVHFWLLLILLQSRCEAARLDEYHQKEVPFAFSIFVSEGSGHFLSSDLVEVVIWWTTWWTIFGRKSSFLLFDCAEQLVYSGTWACGQICFVFSTQLLMVSTC
jgi:hypothetical protein